MLENATNLLVTVNFYKIVTNSIIPKIFVLNALRGAISINSENVRSSKISTVNYPIKILRHVHNVIKDTTLIRLKISVFWGTSTVLLGKMESA